MKNKISKKIVSIVAVVLVIVVALTVTLGIVTKGFRDWKSLDPASDEEQSDETGGLLLGEPTEENGISILSHLVPRSEYAENDISPQAEKAYILTAVIVPEDAGNKLVDWSIGFVNASSTWARGKNVTDYMTITPSADGALTARAECLQAFAEQILITVTSRENSAIKATKPADYVQVMGLVSLSFGTVVCNLGDSSGLTETGVAVEVGRDPVGVVLGGEANLEITLSSVYTVAQEYIVEYELSGQYKFLREYCSGIYDKFLMFGTFAEGYGSENEDFSQSELLNYDCESLYFGFQWFQENLGFQAGGCQPLNSNYWVNTGIFEDYTGKSKINSYIDAFNQIKAGGTVSNSPFTIEYSGLKMFDFTLTLKGINFTAVRYTTFTMTDYTNTTPVRNINWSDDTPESLVF